MLKITPLDLWQEITKARALNEKVNAKRREMITAYAGGHYRSDWPCDGRNIIDNRFDEWLRLVLPQIVFDNPRVSVSTNRSGVNPVVPRALDAALNWWAPQVRLDRVLTEAAYDAAFTFGVLLTTHGPPPGGAPWLSENDNRVIGALPRVTRIAPERWFCDYAIDRYDPSNGHGRLAGHLFRADKQDLLDDDRYNREAVLACAPDVGQDKWHGEKTRRDEVFGYEVWVPEIRTGDHPDAHGTIYTIGLDQNLESGKSARWLREPRSYIGPGEGPYTLVGFGLMPGCPYPFSPFQASWEQVSMLNEHLVAADNSARRHKRFVGYDSENTQAGQAVRTVKDGEVTPIRGLKDGEIKEFVLGGVTREQVEYNNRLGAQVDRSLTLSETARGDINVDTSATAIADAASQRNARLASMKRMMVDAATQVLRTAAWHLYTHTDAVFHLPPDIAESFIPRPEGLPDPQEAQAIADMTGADVMEVRRLLDHQPTVIYGGGPGDEVITQATGADGSPVFVISPNVNGTRFEDFELKIEPYSMERVDEALLQRRAMQVFNTVSAALPMIEQYPQVKWEEMIDMIGEPLNLQNLSDKVLGRAWLARMRQIADGQAPMMMGGQPPGAPTQAGLPAAAPPTTTTRGDGADGMNGQIGESVYGGGDLSRAAIA